MEALTQTAFVHGCKAVNSTAVIKHLSNPRLPERRLLPLVAVTPLIYYSVNYVTVFSLPVTLWAQYFRHLYTLKEIP
jgi:hypothetical protein